MSAVEGANYATVEYMLTGLPVVSTESIGGRSEFFDDDYVKVVDADPKAVARGVREMIDRDIDPELIRRRTLEKVERHRSVFVDLLQGFCDEDGVLRDMRAEWPTYFFNKMMVWQKLGEMQRIRHRSDDGGCKRKMDSETLRP